MRDFLEMTRVAPTIVLAALLCAPQGFAGGERGEDLEALLAGAEEVQRRDLASWREFRFQREVVRRSLDDDSREKKREVLLFLIRPAADGEGFDEHLVLLNGKRPSQRLKDEHREAARFTKRYLQALEQGDEFDNEADPLVHLWGAEQYEDAGLETVGGVLCHRVEMKPSPEPIDGGVRARLAAATAGTLWLAVDGAHIVRSKTLLARPVRLPMGLGTLDRFDVRLVSLELPGGTRLPEEIDVVSEVTVLGKTIRKNNRYRYSAFAAHQRSGG